MSRNHAGATRRGLRSPKRNAARALMALTAAALAVLIVSDLAVTHARAPSPVAVSTDAERSAGHHVASTSAPSMGSTAPIAESKITATDSSSEPAPFHPLTDF
jgi:hypothetical protein